MENNNQYYTYSEGTMFFTYYPLSGIVKPNSHPSAYRVIEHFARRGFEIDWLKTNVQRLNIVVNIPEHLTKEEVDALIQSTKDDLHEAYREDKKNNRDKVIQGNIDNNTGGIIKEDSLRSALSKLKKGGKTREQAADFFNNYNIEEGRPAQPLMITSTKSKPVIVEEGKKILYKLFEQGKLRKLTPEEVSSKLGKLNK